MSKYLVGLGVLGVAAICCIALFANGPQDDTPVQTQDEVRSSYTTNARSESATVAEQQPEAEEFVETDVEAPSNVEVQETAAEPVIVDLPMEAKPEPDDTVSLDSFDRPYNHTVPEEAFLKMSPEDQRAVIGAVMGGGARDLKMGVMGCYQESQSLIRAGDYAAAEEKVAAVLDASSAYDGGQGSLTLARVISLNNQNDALGIMSQIYGAAGNTPAKAQVDARMKELQATMKTLRETQNTSYSMYVNR